MEQTLESYMPSPSLSIAAAKSDGTRKEPGTRGGHELADSAATRALASAGGVTPTD
jgi:hypothetical protein